MEYADKKTAANKERGSFMFKGIFKLIFGTIRLIFFLIVFALIFHTWAIKQLLSFSLSYTLGADVYIRDVKMDFKNTGFEVQGIEIGNPYAFPRERMVDIPLLIVSVDVASIPKGKLHLKTVGFNLRELQVMNVPQKGLNVLALKPLQRAKEVEDEPAFPQTRNRREDRDDALFSIDELIFSIGDIAYRDMNSGATRENLFHAGIRGATYYDVRGTDDIVVIVATEALKKMGFGYLNAQLQKLQERYLSNTVNSGNFLSRAVTAIREKVAS